MKKAILLSAITGVCFISFYASAQQKKINVGIRAGGNLLFPREFIDLAIGKDNPKPRHGYQAGVLAQYNPNQLLYLQSGPSFINRGSKYLQSISYYVDNEVLTGTLKKTIQLSYLQIPLKAGAQKSINSHAWLFADAGIYYAYGT